MKLLMNYFKKRKLRRLFMRIYFSHLNHPLQNPKEALSQSTIEYVDIAKAFYGISSEDLKS